MVFFNWATMQMAAKIVYYGPGLCGKTSNLSFIYAKTAPTSRGEMVSLETESDRTLFFDLLPIEVGTIGGFKTRLQLYTVPGQVFYNTTRKLVLKGVDGLVFVADSQRPMREANIESFRSLVENIEELNLDLKDLPLVFQYNKRDLKNILTMDELNEDLNPEGIYPYYPSSAINGDGVFETLKAITKFTLKKLRKRMASPQATSGPPKIIKAPLESARPKPGVISAASLAEAAEEAVGEVELTPPPAIAESSEVSQSGVRLPAAEVQTVSPDAGEPFGEAPAPLMEEEQEEIEEIEMPGVSDQMVDPNEKTGPMDAPESIEFEMDDSGDFEEEPETLDELDEEAEELLLEDAVEVEAEETPGDLAEADPPQEDEDEDEYEEEEEDSVDVDFDTSTDRVEEVQPPPVKRVHVSSQMDILSELDELRRQTTEPSRKTIRTQAPSLDLDSLLGASDSRKKSLKRRIEKSLNSNIFKEMESVQLALRIVNSQGETVHTLDPVSVKVENAEALENLLLQLTIDLENAQRS